MQLQPEQNKDQQNYFFYQDAFFNEEVAESRPKSQSSSIV